MGPTPLPADQAPPGKPKPKTSAGVRAFIIGLVGSQTLLVWIFAIRVLLLQRKRRKRKRKTN
ncbi:MAG: hypothetical protein JSR82_20120 [Verrucomicrobia bacterium]|nr:hypothetical protein [Verrucomicrobiota bacterium]